MEKTKKYISYEAKAEHLYLIDLINENSGYVPTLHAPLQQAIQYLLSLDKAEAVAGLKAAAVTSLDVPAEYAEKGAKSVKTEVEIADADKADMLFLEAFAIKKIQRPFFAKILLRMYYNYILREKNKVLKKVPVAVEAEAEYDLFAIAHEVMDMLFKNEEQDASYIREISELIIKRKKVMMETGQEVKYEF